MTDLQNQIANFQEALNYFFSVNSSIEHFALGDFLAAIVNAVEPPFTEGSIPFGSATGLLTQDSAFFQWNDTTKSLGVGTAAGSAVLTIASQTANNNDIISVTDPSTAYMQYGVLNLHGGGNPRLTISTGPSSGTFANGELLLTGGLGGILYIQSTQSDAGYQACALTMNGNDQFVIKHVQDNLSGTISTPFLMSVQAPTNAFYMNYQGYVGLNISVPQYQLDVGGTARATTVMTSSLNSTATQTTLTGSAGTAVCSQPFQGTSYKKVVIYLNGYSDVGSQIYTFPTPFSKTPYVYGLAAGVSGATASTTSVTFTVTTQTGFVFIEGY